MPYDSPRADALLRVLVVATPILIAIVSLPLFLILYGLPLVLFGVLWILDIGLQIVFGSEALSDNTMGAFLLLPYTGFLYALTGEEDFLIHRS